MVTWLTGLLWCLLCHAGYSQWPCKSWFPKWKIEKYVPSESETELQQKRVHRTGLVLDCVPRGFPEAPAWLAKGVSQLPLELPVLSWLSGLLCSSLDPSRVWDLGLQRGMGSVPRGSGVSVQGEREKDCCCWSTVRQRGKEAPDPFRIIVNPAILHAGLSSTTKAPFFTHSYHTTVLFALSALLDLFSQLCLMPSNSLSTSFLPPTSLHH